MEQIKVIVNVTIIVLFSLNTPIEFVSIERENLTLRKRIKRLNRKMLSYSKSPELLNNVVMY